MTHPDSITNVATPWTKNCICAAGPHRQWEIGDSEGNPICHIFYTDVQGEFLADFLLACVNQRAALLSANAELTEALADIADHFASVMGGPMISGKGIVFERGVDGIPTIAKARAALAAFEKGPTDAVPNARIP